MSSHSDSIEDPCPHCGNTLSATLRHCPTCQADAGAPNVRRCNTVDNKNRLKSRYEEAKDKAKDNNLMNEFSELERLIREKSGVVVSMTAATARKLFEDDSAIYVNYERLVGAKARTPANSKHDQHRCAVSGALFGSYAESIIYGVLSLTGGGLPTYGPVYCRLRSITIDWRQLKVPSSDN